MQDIPNISTPSNLCLQVAGILHIWIIRSVPLPVFPLLLLHKAGHHQDSAHAHVLWVHGHCLICLLLPDRHDWILCMLPIRQEDILCRQD